MNIFQRIIIEPFERFFERVLQFLPNFITALLIFIVGIVFGIILKGLFLKFFNAVSLDKFSERSGMIELMRKGGIRDSLSVLLSRIIEWITIVVFAVISLKALEVSTVERIFERILLYLPNVFIASLLLLFGYLLGNFLGRAALIASVNAGIKVSGLIGRFVKFAIFIFAGTMALEQLGIGRETVVIAFTIIFGGIVLALSIAFGLGGKEIARTYLEKKFLKEEEKDDIKHI
ncbi:MAG: hypothetical protein HY578_05695 [Nitrospinae bacterium]|nr:hypothetical protein [Nitrospinota bacterium]